MKKHSVMIVPPRICHEKFQIIISNLNGIQKNFNQKYKPLLIGLPDSVAMLATNQKSTFFTREKILENKTNFFRYIYHTVNMSTHKSWKTKVDMHR